MTLFERLLSGSALGGVVALPAVATARTIADAKRAAYSAAYFASPIIWAHVGDTRLRPEHKSGVTFGCNVGSHERYRKCPQLTFYTTAVNYLKQSRAANNDWEIRALTAARDVGARIEGDTITLPPGSQERFWWKIRNHYNNYGYTVRGFGDVQ